MTRIGADCMVPNCGRVVMYRGLCLPCYQTAIELVRLEAFSWEKLERWGLCKPSTHEKKRRRAFMEALEKAAKEETS